MVATLLKLKFRLVISDLKRSTARLVLYIFLSLYALGIIAMILIGMGAASLVVPGHEAETSAISIIFGAILVVGWVLLPLVFFGSDQTLDPSRFTQFPLRGRQLAPGLVIAGVIGLPGLMTALVCLGMGLPWLSTPLVMVMGFLGGVLGFLMTQVGCRVASTALSGILSSRKAKDMTGLIGLVVILLLAMVGYGISLGAAFLTESGNAAQAMALALNLSTVLAWTPLGSSWAIVGAIGQGQWILALGYLVVTIVYLVLGMWLYSKILDKALVAPTQAAPTAEVGKYDLIDRIAHWTWAQSALVPVAAIMARCLRYWRRDPRYLGQIPAILMMPILFSIMGWAMNHTGEIEGMPGFLSTGFMAFGLGFAAIMAGYSLSADVSSDSTAWWLHLAAGVKGWQDRLGRVFAQIIWALPLILILAIAVPLFMANPGRIPTTLGAMVTLYLSGLGLACVFSALIIYPVALPGESPLKMKTGMMGSQMLSQFGSLTIAGVLALPVCIWAIFAESVQAWLVLVVGILWGAILLIAGIILGGRIMDSRGPAILASLMKNDSRERS